MAKTKTMAGINLTKLRREAEAAGMTFESLLRADEKGEQWLNFDILPSNYDEDRVYLLVNLGKENRDTANNFGSIGAGKSYEYRSGKKSKSKTDFKDNRTSDSSKFQF